MAQGWRSLGLQVLVCELRALNSELWFALRDMPAIIRPYRGRSIEKTDNA